MHCSASQLAFRLRRPRQALELGALFLGRCDRGPRRDTLHVAMNMTQVSAKVSVWHYWSFGIMYFLCSPAQLHSTDGTMINTLKQVGKALLKKVAPKTFWSMRLSALRQSFGEKELHIVPSLCDKSKMSIDIGAAGGIYTAHIVNLLAIAWRLSLVQRRPPN